MNCRKERRQIRGLLHSSEITDWAWLLYVCFVKGFFGMVPL